MKNGKSKNRNAGVSEINGTYFPTVAEVLSLPIFKKVRIYGDKKRMKTRVSGIYIMDVPDYERWFAPGEMLVSTCYAIHDDKAALKNLIPSLYRSGASAAFIKPGRFLGEMPKTMINAAKKLSFPLIELPDETRFADITKAVSDEILRRQQELLQKSLSVNETLTQMITAGAGLPEIAEQIGALTSRSVLIQDRINGRDAVFIRKDDEEKLSVKNDAIPVKKITKESRAYEIKLNEEDYGALYLYGSAPERLNEEMLKHITRAIPLEIGRYRSVREHEERNFNDFFFHLISDQIVDETMEIARAKTMSFDLNEIHFLAQLRIADSFSDESYSALFKRDYFVQSLRARMRDLKLPLHIIDNGRGFYLLFSDADGEPARKSLILAQIKKSLSDLFRANKELTIAAGCSRWHSGITGIKSCASEAALALRYASSRAKSHIAVFDDLGVIRLLYAADPRSETERFISDTLRDLAHKRTEKEDALLETLNAFFEFQGNQRKMASALFIHYNTVSYRLEQIQERTGLDLGSHTDRLRAALALYLLQAMQPEQMIDAIEAK